MLTVFFLGARGSSPTFNCGWDSLGHEYAGDIVDGGKKAKNLKVVSAAESMYHFVGCLRDGNKPLTNGEDGLPSAGLILAAKESARTDKSAEI